MSAMTVTVYSFSFRRGLPKDETGNDGGFVFDCRAMPNPFWTESLREFTGRDQPVVDFFSRYKSAVDDFLSAAWTLIQQSIQAYAQDGREHLYVAFGCTGRQHRSVYFAEQMAMRLKEQNAVKVKLVHANQENWKTGIASEKPEAQA